MAGWSPTSCRSTSASAARLNPLSFSIRDAHFDSMDAAIAYVTDWAIQWEARLRDGVHVPSPL